MNISIHLLDQGRTLRAESGLSLLEALMRHGIFLRTDCGGKGTCGKCKVVIMHKDGNPETVKACGHTLVGDIRIQIPPSSIPPSFVMDKAKLSFPDSFAHPHLLEGPEEPNGIAIDLGTTTIAVYLCDFRKREVISTIALKNPQSLFGADVMTRITAVVENKNTLETMQNLTVKSIEWGIRKLLASFTGQAPALSKMVVVGNPAMIHIFTGTNPKPIGVSPYQPVFHEARRFDSRDLSFTLDTFNIFTLPNLSGFLGGDILAAAQAADMEDQPDGTLLIDLGTNGELVLKHKQTLHATSCATGPAFEGATLACGIQAVPGAINAIEIGDNLETSKISMVHSKGHPSPLPSGICGAGVLNTVAQLCRKKIIKPGGAFRNGQDRFILVPENRETGQACIYISQKDIRSVQLGKSALFTGIHFLMKKAGIEALEKIMIAGAFGAHMNPSDLKRLGMIPDMDDERIEIAGNLAGSGAVMALCDDAYIVKAAKMAEGMETVDLARDAGFQNAFIENLDFPE
jgi:uncharacterized 2Fe-2S/4Fe-4S cluster protein (DUF4445 family)